MVQAAEAGVEASEASLRFGGAVQKELTGTETILFVEDEVFVREVACEVLRSAGYKVLTARNADEAARVYDQRCSEIELLVTDVVLPGENGRALALRLRQKHPELKVLFVTGYAEQMGLQESLHEECLAKPFSATVLLRRVQQLLDQGESWTESEQVRHACGTG